MKLLKLFASAALAVGLSFTANAGLITQSFDFEVEGVTATLQIGAMTENSNMNQSPNFSWDYEEISYFNIVDLTGLAGAPGPQSFMFSGADFLDPNIFSLLSVSAFSDSSTGQASDTNGFFEVLFELPLAIFDNALAGILTVELYNDEFGQDLSVVVFDNGETSYQGSFTAGDVSVEVANVNAPAAAALILLSIGGLFASRRK